MNIVCKTTINVHSLRHFACRNHYGHDLQFALFGQIYNVYLLKNNFGFISEKPLLRWPLDNIIITVLLLLEDFLNRMRCLILREKMLIEPVHVCGLY